jgi:hypothetical protein
LLCYATTCSRSGENTAPSLQYEINAWHPQWRAGLEIEAGRAWMGNAIYCDLIEALVMVKLEHLILAVPNAYRCKNDGRDVVSNDHATRPSIEYGREIEEAGRDRDIRDVGDP